MQEGDTNTCPQRKDARNPDPDEQARGLVNQEPKADADEQARQSCAEEIAVQRLEHGGTLPSVGGSG